MLKLLVHPFGRNSGSLRAADYESVESGLLVHSSRTFTAVFFSLTDAICYESPCTYFYSKMIYVNLDDGVSSNMLRNHLISMICPHFYANLS
jgi:hypothetical protein